jgi:hypothetical protein
MASTKVKIDFDNLKYIANIERGGLYKVVAKCVSGKSKKIVFTLRCVYGKGVENEDGYNSSMHCNNTQIEVLIEKNSYVPMFDEKDELVWKIKYGC